MKNIQQKIVGMINPMSNTGCHIYAWLALDRYTLEYTGLCFVGTLKLSHVHSEISSLIIRGLTMSNETNINNSDDYNNNDMISDIYHICIYKKTATASICISNKVGQVRKLQQLHP